MAETPPWLEYQGAAPARGRVFTLPPNPKDVRSEARAEEDQQLQRETAARVAATDARNAANEAVRIQIALKAEQRAEEQARRASAKPMRTGDADKFEDEIGIYSSLKQARDGFNDKYAGNTVTGRLETWGQKAFSGIGTPGQAEWWADLYSADNVVRNKMFGASLTTGEQAAYERTTVNPSMDPKIVRQRLAKRTEIIQKALARKTNRLRTVYNKDEVEAALGEFKDDFIPRDQQVTPSPDAKSTNALENAADNFVPQADQFETATDKTRTEITRTALDKKISALLASGASDASIRSLVKGHNYTNVDDVLAWRKANRKYKGSYDVHSETIVPTTVFNRMAAHPIAAGALAAVDAGTAGLTDEVTGAVNALRTGQPLDESIAAADFAKQMQAAANPRATLLGNVLGGAGAMVSGGLGANALLRAGAKGGTGRNALAWAARNPYKSAILGDMGYGAAYGAGQNNDNRVLGSVVGAGTAAVASPVGQLLAKGAGATLQGVVNPAVDRLRAAGIPVSAGEVLGGGWKKAQDAVASYLPGVSSRYNEGRRALNLEAFNTAGNIVDTPINAVGQKGINALDAAKSQAYRASLDPVTLNLNTPGFRADIDAALNAAEAIPNADQASDIATGAIRNYTGEPVKATGGVMNGPDFQQAYRGLSQVGKKSAPRIYGEEISTVLGRVKDSLTGTLEAQNPGAYAGFLKANSANRHLSVLADAVNAAKNQVSDGGEVLATPAQLGTAATSNAKTFGSKIAAAGGNRPFNQLISDAQQVMSSKVPDSGTATRLAVGLGLTGAGGGTGYAADEGSGIEGAAKGAAIPAAAMAFLGTRRGQQLLTAALLKRIAPFRTAGAAMRRNPQVGGDILTAAGIPLLDSR